MDPEVEKATTYDDALAAFEALPEESPAEERSTDEAPAVVAVEPVAVAAGEPASDEAAVPIDHGDLDGDPLPLDEPDQQGPDEERHSDAEADPGQHLADDGDGVHELHDSIVERTRLAPARE